MALSGFNYFYGLLQLPTELQGVRYDFNVSGSVVPSASGAPILRSGLIEGISNGVFWDTFGSGHFNGSGQLEITHATGLASDFWTHMMIYEKTVINQGILFSSLQGSGGFCSGYLIGTTDSNQLYFESQCATGPQTYVSNQIYNTKNMVAVSRADGVVTFSQFDFGTNSILTDSALIHPYVESRAAAFLGGSPNLPSQSLSGKFVGYMDEYAYINAALMADALQVLFSGWSSQYQVYAPVVAMTGYIGITGYNYAISGVTGITGYSYNYNSSGAGLDIFGDPIMTGYTTPLTGYLLSGLVQTPMTGWIGVPITGAPSGSMVTDLNFGLGFGQKRVTLLRQIIGNDELFCLSAKDWVSGVFNNLAQFDRINSDFELDDVFDTGNLLVFRNGILQLPTTGEITGNIYGSGLQVTDGYSVVGHRLYAGGLFNDTDAVVYDVVPVSLSYITGIDAIYSGQTITGFSSGNINLVFLNGLLQVDPVDTLSGKWNRGGFGGALAIYHANTGQYVSFTNLASDTLFIRGSTQLFMNGQRQVKGFNYVENSTVDLLNLTGLFDNSLVPLYNNLI